MNYPFLNEWKEPASRSQKEAVFNRLRGCFGRRAIIGLDRGYGKETPRGKEAMVISNSDFDNH